MALRYDLYWLRGREPVDVFGSWAPRVHAPVMAAFAKRLRRGAWYRRINRDTGFSGRNWTSAVRPGSRTHLGVLYGAYYVPFIRSRGTTGTRALQDAWRRFDANRAVRDARVMP